MRKFMLSALLLAGLLPALALAAAPESFTVGTLHVSRYGEHGRPLILIPGLECGAWEWQATIEHFETNHVIYAVTLAGFDGTPPPARKTDLLDQANASLLRLIEDHHIDKPVLVGHSLGGTLALRFAGEHAKLISGALAVDGLPVFPDMSVSQRAAGAQQARAQYARMTPTEFERSALEYMQNIGVINPELAARYAPLLARSDAAISGEYAAEDMLADYRPLLKHADVPVLEVSPYYAPDFQRFAAMLKQPVISEAQKAAYYQSLLANAPNAKVVSISPSRHFVMLDQPAKFRAVLERFLADLPQP
ncbi:MAG: alpha/beta fold hydrolase [Gammaproteobacteria bacterium]